MGFLKHAVRMIAAGEGQMNSVERLQYYANEITPEAAKVVDGNRPDTSWPSAGTIEVKDLTLRYRGGPKVLKNVTFSVKAHEKIGVVGRTGAGKSSLMSVLLRIFEPEEETSIVIDDIDTRKIGLDDLRSGIGIIPQEPWLLGGASVRYNLDPLGKYSDEQLLEALGEVELHGAIMKTGEASLKDENTKDEDSDSDEDVDSKTDKNTETPKLSDEKLLEAGLSAIVAEGGNNFSVGERQLLCITRAVLRNPTLLLLDECTASVDNKTDEMIQKMIRQKFKDITVLTIAHRINTIIGSDRVLVLVDGEVAEFDSPASLLENETGEFHGMVKETGQYAELEKAARVSTALDHSDVTLAE